MNPFLLAGPRFLLFYLVIAVAVVLVLWGWLRFSGGTARLKASELTADPYRIACLRSGEMETVRIALFNLVDRGLLTFNNEYLIAARPDAAELVRRPLDRAILAECRAPVTAKDILRNARILPEAARYRVEITNKGLLHAKQLSLAVILAGCGLLAGIGLAKIVVAFTQGRQNFVFLAMLMLAACWLLANVVAATPTRAGAEMLAQLRFMTHRLKARADSLKSGGATNEALLLACVFGLRALPEDEFAFITWLFPRPRASEWEPDSSEGMGSGSDSCGGGGGCGGCGGG